MGSIRFGEGDCLLQRGAFDQPLARQRLPEILQDGGVFRAGRTKTGLKIKYNILRCRCRQIANAIGGILLHPDKDLIIIDMGTATTFDAITFDRNYLGAPSRRAKDVHAGAGDWDRETSFGGDRAA